MKQKAGVFLCVLTLSLALLLTGLGQAEAALAADAPMIAQAGGQGTMPPTGAEQPQATKSKKKRKHPILMYLPNRIFDLLDIFRVRVRIGPGISVGARATTPASVFLGHHNTVFVGLHGPRGKAAIPWPAGTDMRAGAQASVVDLSSKEVYYGPLEVGLEVQPVIVGFNLGIGVFEVLDFATGFLFIDLQRDDF